MGTRLMRVSAKTTSRISSGRFVHGCRLADERTKRASPLVLDPPEPRTGHAALHHPHAASHRMTRRKVVTRSTEAPFEGACVSFYAAGRASTSASAPLAGGCGNAHSAPGVQTLIFAPAGCGHPGHQSITAHAWTPNHGFA